jgi:PleD family two-component response regulator
MLASADDSVHPWPTILVIDDSPEDRTAVHAMLVHEGYTVVSTTADQGLAGFEAERPDCVLVGLLTTEIDPLSLCQTIRALPEGRYISILALATRADDDVIDDAWLAGCDDILLKPLRATELLSHVRTAFKLRYMDARFREQRHLLRKQYGRLTRLERQNKRLKALLLRERARYSRHSRRVPTTVQ